jgi:hypothetical protein
MNTKSLSRFKFNIKDNDYEFNFSVVIDIMYFNSKLVLQVVDVFISFQAASFLKDMSARTAWDILRLCWIDIYLGLLDNIIYDTRKNFVSVEFRQYAKSIAIQVQEMPVETYNSIGKVERYYTLLQQVYKIICNEFHDTSIKMNL